MRSRATFSAAAGGLAFAAVLVWAAYRQGLFYDADLYLPEAILMGLAACAGVWYGFKQRRAFPVWSLAPFGLAAAYGIAWMAGPASIKGTMDSVLRWSGYGAWLVIAAMFLAKPLNRRAGSIAFHAAGAFVVWGGLAGWFGWLSYPEMIFYSGDAALSSTGARLAGFLQYPNAYAAIVGLLAISQWQLLDSTDRRVRGFGSLLLICSLTALMLTESRGAVLALALGGIVSLLARPANRRGYALAAAGVAIGLSAVAAHRAFAAMEAGAPASAAWVLIAAAVVGGGVIGQLRVRAPQASETPGSGAGWLAWRNRAAAAGTGKWGGAIIFALGIAAAYLLLVGGDSGGARVEGHLETAAARQLYYADALRMFMDRPWFGAGGETWRMLVGLYQQKPYIGNEVHSGYLEVLIDTGLVGCAALGMMLIWFALRLKRYRAAGAWGPAAVWLAHAAVDFDWSYGFGWLYLLFGLALYVSADEPGTVEGQLQAQASVASRYGGRRRLAAAVLPALLLLGVAAAAVPVAWRFAHAARAEQAALAAQGTAARMALLREAQAANPAWNRIRLELAPLLPLQERPSLLKAGLRYEPQSPPLAYALGMAYAELRDVANAQLYLGEALRLSRFDRDAQDATIATMETLAERLQMNGEPEQARLAAAAGTRFFEQYRDLYARLYAGKMNPWSSTKLFTSAKFNAAACYIRLGQRDKATPLLREVVAQGDPDWKARAEELLQP